MTKPENPLTRWSRRKQQAAKQHAVKKDDDKRSAPEKSAIEGDIIPPSINESTKPAVDIAALPPIDSITAQTDIRAFLAPGVPQEVASAALRRAWAADPAIRDFVGLADYAWDYHAPGSMPGFGPLEMTDDLRKHVARILGVSRAEIEPDAISNDRLHSQPLPHPMPGATASPRQFDGNRHDDRLGLSNAQVVAGDAVCDDSSHSKIARAASKDDRENVEAMKPVSPPRRVRVHGRALPK